MIRWIKSLFTHKIHFHTMEENGPGVCGVGGRMVFTKDQVNEVNCARCRTWLERHPGYPKHATAEEWLKGRP